MIILGFVSYPLCLETLQAYKGGIGDYLTDMSNLLDIIFIWGSIGMSILHYNYGPLTFYSKLIMVVVLLSAIRRTFNFLRIFRPLTTIVTMLN